MDLQTYSKIVITTAPDLGIYGDMIHGALGACTEAAELGDIAKRQIAYGKSPDIVHMKEEIGDVMWYLNLLVCRFDLTWDEVLQGNVDKLSVRYPGLAFTQERALNRDTDAERAALESGNGLT